MRGKIKRMATNSMFVAMYVVLSMVSLDLWTMKFTFDGLPIILGAMLFGPVDGMAIGLMGAFINQMIDYGFSVTTLLWILPAGIRGLLVGLYAKKYSFELNHKQVVFITVLSALVVTTVNTAVMYIDSKIYGYYSIEYVFGLILVRYAAGVLTAIVFASIVPSLTQTIERTIKYNHKNQGNI